ncbi:MAG: hypothetical protein ABSH22_07740 [Tepidisphaeraceae bacterium]
MPIKTIQARTQNFRLGRRRPVAHCPRLSLGGYMMSSLPPPPATCDYTQAATSALSQMYGNDKLGDCVIAGMGHVVGVLTGNAGLPPFLYTSAQIIALYEAIGGYDPADPTTDQGCDEQTALNYWENTGAPAGSHQIAGWLAVDATNRIECQTAMYLFENLFFGVELPDAWINPAPPGSGFVWDTAGDPDPANGHAFVGIGYDARGITISTWGMTGTLTYAAMAAYATTAAGGGLYTVVSQDALNNVTKKAPNGFDWSQLVADFDSMDGAVKPGTARSGVSRVGGTRKP